ncbi:MAG: hypothetical protein IT555_18340 [Acetobacteraceae bacterium]|nr:hypothetical protein [Acetobacteraceae bacterium]
MEREYCEHFAKIDNVIVNSTSTENCIFFNKSDSLQWSFIHAGILRPARHPPATRPPGRRTRLPVGDAKD